MKKIKIDLKLVIIAGVILLTGLGFILNNKPVSDEEKYSFFIRNTKTASQGGEILLKEGTLFSINLEITGTSGYYWYYEWEGEALMILKEEALFDLYKKERSDYMVGNLNKVWKWQAVKKGKAKLVYSYYRQWEGKESIIKKEVFEIQID
ncbi:MAG TPA: hypothetical protein DHW82_08335 [Spirochaetia bacterium]|nr:MAG: hypothetical protein A2Y41_13935 [Spirochaetes bacterium GWB1_36_13]HCL56999.1 hypothetical protein [Spirochaetia bacterium]